MHTYQELANSGLLYGLVIAGLAYMVVLCLVFYTKTRKKAFELGVTKETMSRIHKATISLTVVPSISIVIGLITLSAVIGIPWAWFRLSVVGAVTYELIAAQMATAALGFTEMTAAMASDAQTFGAMMFVMSIGIISGIVINFFIGKRLQTTMGKVGGNPNGFGQILNGCFMVALMGVMMPFQFHNGLVHVAVFLTAMVVTVALNMIIKATGWRWLGDFSMAFTLILGMASAILWTSILR